ncbi:MAG: peptidase MA family metallohydrolase [Dehalococcoidia bacterium]
MRLTARVPRIFALALVAAAFALLFTLTAASADTIETDEPRELIEDPLGITFVVRVRAAAGLESAELIYKLLNPDGDVGGSGKGTFTPGVETDVTFLLETQTFERFIPIGSTFVYHWELVDSEGDRFSTPEREFTFLDGRFNWFQLTRTGVTVYWYGDNESKAMTALDVTRESMENISQLLETAVPYTVKVIVYGSGADGALAQRSRGVLDQYIDTQGQRVAPDLLLIYEPNPDVIRHEAAHIVTHVAGDGPFTSLPSWIDEGVAVFAQSTLSGGYRSAIEFGVSTDTTLSLREMGAPPNRAGLVNLFYGQSYSVVQFLIDEYGQQQLAEAFRVHYAGSRIDGALLEVYGFDQNGLYNIWRQANGLRPVTLVAPPTATTSPAAVATRAPIALPGATATGGDGGNAAAAEATATSDPETGEPAASDDRGSGSSAGIVIAVVTLLAVLALGGGAVALLRRESRAN